MKDFEVFMANDIDRLANGELTMPSESMRRFQDFQKWYNLSGDVLCILRDKRNGYDIVYYAPSAHKIIRAEIVFSNDFGQRCAINHVGFSEENLNLVNVPVGAVMPLRYLQQCFYYSWMFDFCQEYIGELFDDPDTCILQDLNLAEYLSTDVTGMVAYGYQAHKPLQVFVTDYRRPFELVTRYERIV